MSFKQDLDILFNNFLKALENWVEDFENLALRRKEASNISPRFLERHAKLLINAFDELILALSDEYEKLILEYTKITPIEKKKDILECQKNFKIEGSLLLQRANVKAKLLLEDFQKIPFSSLLTIRLKEISSFTYDDLISKLKQPE